MQRKRMFSKELVLLCSYGQYLPFYQLATSNRLVDLHPCWKQHSQSKSRTKMNFWPKIRVISKNFSFRDALVFLFSWSLGDILKASKPSAVNMKAKWASVKSAVVSNLFRNLSKSSWATKLFWFARAWSLLFTSVTATYSSCWRFKSPSIWSVKEVITTNGSTYTFHSFGIAWMGVSSLDKLEWYQLLLRVKWFLLPAQKLVKWSCISVF